MKIDKHANLTPDFPVSSSLLKPLLRKVVQAVQYHLPYEAACIVVFSPLCSAFTLPRTRNI